MKIVLVFLAVLAILGVLVSIFIASRKRKSVPNINSSRRADDDYTVKHETNNIEELKKLLALVEKNEYKTTLGKPAYMWAWKKFLEKHHPTSADVDYFQQNTYFSPAWARFTKINLRIDESTKF